MELTDQIQYLKGVGEKRAKLYAKLGISTLEELLTYYPRRYLDLSQVTDLSQTVLGEFAAVRVRILSKGGEQHIRKALSVFKVKAADETMPLTAVFFNTKFTVDALEIESDYIFYGKIEGSLFQRQMNSPMVFPGDTRGLIPIYALTAGISSKMIGSNARQLLPLAEKLPEPLPQPIRERNRLCRISYAVRHIHFPTDPHSLEISKRRLIFEELFLLSLALRSIKDENKMQTGCGMRAVSLAPFYQALPFTLTGAQQRAIAQCAGDLQGSFPMNRLVQGDVGSGKTVVAAACCYCAAKNGMQAAMMAPTEILAQQHFDTLQKLLGGMGLRIALLTGSTAAAQKREIKRRLAAGEVDICVGTHAIFTDDVAYRRLALVITDEQHRFGVSQRVKLTEKGENPHVLVMSATPIPRTLALMIYGDLDVSVIDELPPGRQVINTYKIDSGKRERAYQFIKKHFDEGRQAFVVCPLVEESEEDNGLKAATAYAHSLQEGPFASYRVGLLHGKMRPAEKERVMGQFKNHELDLLVSTTVVEVGVDVPNAVIMMIENAERFGLSQLHQLRGRVGRGNHQSSCILLSDAKSPETLERLRVMCRTNDGFEVAQFDLKLRGPGDFFGSRQHGLPQLKVADLIEDADLLDAAQQEAQALLLDDPQLNKEENISLRHAVDKLLRSVGERLN